MKNNTELQTLIASMLTENTGRDLCDSGGAYGRNWERNTGKTFEDFEKEPEAILEIYRDSEFMPRVSVYHKLTDGTLELDDLCREFNALPVPDWDCEDYYGVSQTGGEWLELHGFTPKGNGFNTYNGDNNFSQVLQGNFLTHSESDDIYLLLQIHGGCDVRGGYTDAKLFKVDTAYQEEWLVLRDDCSFCVETDDDTPKEFAQWGAGYLCLDWSGEWIDREGTVPSDEYFAEFARLARKQAGNPKGDSDAPNPSIYLHGDIMSY